MHRSQVISPSPYVQQFFRLSAKSKYLCIFCFLLFLLCGPPERQNLQGKIFFSFLINIRFVLFCRDLGIYFHVKFQRILCISFRFWCVHIPFCNIVRFKSLIVHQWSSRPGFNTRSSYTKDSKYGTWSYLPNPSARAGYETRSVFFKAEFNRFEFRVFLLLDKLPQQGWRTQSVLLFTHSWRGNNWIHTFPKGISAMWNAISLVQDLNTGRRVHFLRR